MDMQYQARQEYQPSGEEETCPIIHSTVCMYHNNVPYGLDCWLPRWYSCYVSADVQHGPWSL